MRSKQKIWLSLAVVQLGLAVCGAAHFPWWKLGGVGRWIQQYGVFTGSSSVFNFFAPSVGQSTRAEFDLYDKNDRFLATDHLPVGPSHEANLRAVNIVEFITNDLEDNNSRHLLSASWVAKMFARHPEASFIVLRVETFDVPYMEDYRRGERSTWQTVYRAKFAREKAPSRG